MSGKHQDIGSTAVNLRQLGLSYLNLRSSNCQAGGFGISKAPSKSKYSPASTPPAAVLGCLGIRESSGSISHNHSETSIAERRRTMIRAKPEMPNITIPRNSKTKLSASPAECTLRLQVRRGSLSNSVTQARLPTSLQPAKSSRFQESQGLVFGFNIKGLGFRV